MSARTPTPRLWWTTWPGALGMGALALVLGLPGLIAGLAGLLLTDGGGAGLDFEVAGAGWGQRILWSVLLAAGVVLPVLTVRWARKKWAGYLLLGVGLSFVVGVVGLFELGIL